MEADYKLNFRGGPVVSLEEIRETWVSGSLFSQETPHFYQDPGSKFGVFLGPGEIKLGGYFQLGNNCRFFTPCSIGAKCLLGNRVIINAGSVIEDFVVLDDFTLTGEEVLIETRCVIRASSCINSRVHLKPNVMVGREVQIGHDCVVDSHVKFTDSQFVNPGIAVKRNLLVIQGSRDLFMIVDPNPDAPIIKIGCHRHALADWLSIFMRIGMSAGYSGEEIEEYKAYLDLVSSLYAKKSS